MEKIIQVKNLKKSYGDIDAVKGIDFYVEKGKLFAFVGPNGAGKSTTIDMICTLLKPDEGEVIINGNHLGKHDSRIRSDIGVVFQDGLLDSLLSVKENLTIRGNFYKLSKKEMKNAVKAAADATGIWDFIDRPYGKLSGGQKRRADIARALINSPKILFLDEPTTGLDPQTRKNIWDTIEEMQRRSGMTVFLTTHYMEEAAKADYLIVIDNGEISAKGTPSQLRERYSNDALRITPLDIELLCQYLNKADIPYEVESGIVVIKLKSTLDSLSILPMIKDKISGFEVIRGTMDDTFIGITGKEIRE